MPIAYSIEKKGWYLDNPTEAELEQIQELGTNELVKGISRMVMERFIEKQAAEDEKDEGVTVQ